MGLNKSIIGHGLLAITTPNKENKPSLSWEEDLKVKMQTKTKNEWKEILIEHDLKDCNVMQVNESEDWAGTLIFWGFKNAL